MQTPSDNAPLWDPLFVNNLIQVLVGALEVKDSYTQGHAKRVAELCLCIGSRMGFSPAALRDLYVAAMLHDIGKIIGTPQQMLNKPEQLDHHEETIMREHPMKASLLIVGLENLAHLVPSILHHHERWDGAGYPARLKGDAIPLHARIICVADAYEAMVSPRSFREPISKEQACQELTRLKGIQFDPQVVDHLLACLQETPHELKDFSYYFS